MENYSMSYEQLMNLPYEKYLEISKIMSLEAKEEKKEAERQERKAQ